MGSATSAISIHFDGEQPFVAGQRITGTVMFDNTLEPGVKLQRIYAEFVGEIFYMTEYRGSIFMKHKSFFRQLINLKKQQEESALENGNHSWSISSSLPTFLPPSLNRLSAQGPYLHYKVHVTLEQPEIFKMNIHQEFPIRVIASPVSSLRPSYLPTQLKNKNRSGVTVRAALTDQKSCFAPGERFLLNIELHNPKHNTVDSLLIYLVQYRDMWIGGHCKQIIPLVDLAHLREFAGENYCETLQLTMPNDDCIVPSFYMSPEFSSKRITVKYILKIRVITYGFFKDFILNIPIVLQSMEMYMVPPNEDEAPPPSYDLVVGTH